MCYVDGAMDERVERESLNVTALGFEPQSSWVPVFAVCLAAVSELITGTTLSVAITKLKQIWFDSIPECTG